MSAKFSITYGGWYQRTTLHLTEIYAFLSQGFSKLDLSKDKLSEFHTTLNITEVTREVSYLEYVKAKTKEGIEIRYFEDGLYVLEITSSDIEKSRKLLEDYFENNFNPAINYIFSLGAPTPKILANIKTTHPVAVGIESQDDFKVDERKYGQVYSQITSGDMTVYKTENYIFVVSKDGKVKDIIETQIFFREFKDQLEKYLNIHRKIWEEISDIKERQSVKGSEVEKLRARLDQYQKTVDLIDSRINQMGSYLQTRASLSKELKIEQHLNTLFQFKFEALADTHSYVKEIWQMTKNYLATAIDIIKEIESKAVNTNIISLQIITSIGVVSGILGYLAADQLPKVTSTGLIYLLLLIVVIVPINFLIRAFYRNQKYKLTFPDQAKNI